MKQTQVKAHHLTMNKAYGCRNFLPIHSYIKMKTSGKRKI